MRHLFFLMSFLLATSVSAQQAAETLPIGLWKGSTTDGHRVSVTLTQSYCYLETTWASGHVAGQCGVQKTGPAIQIQIDNRSASTFTSPEYNRPINEAWQIQGLTSRPNVALFLDNLSSKKMSGHLVGAGGNIHVTLRKH